jgi:ribosomal protein L37AE/L43A
VVYRTGRLTVEDYEEAIEALRDGQSQLEPDGRPCAVCHDGGHQAQECHHNPLVLARNYIAITSGVWVCFHCGVRFTDEATAREHFGTSEEEIARCLVDHRLPGEKDG